MVIIYVGLVIIVEILSLDQLANFCIENSLKNFDPRTYKESSRAEIIRDISFPKDPLMLGIFGSAFEMGDQNNIDTSHAQTMAKYLAEKISYYKDDVVLVTGYCPDSSLPSIVAAEVKKIEKSIPIIGISPWKDYQESNSQARKHGQSMTNSQDIHDLVIYGDFGDYRMRDGLNCLFVDGAIALRGSSGTNDEIAGLYETGKVIGLLTGSGGVTDHQSGIIKAIKEDGKNHYVVFQDNNPTELVCKVLGQIYVDHQIREEKETSAVDIYLRNKKNGHLPILNIRRFRRKRPEIDWKKEVDRPYPLETYNRPDISYAGKLVLGTAKSTVKEQISELTKGKLIEPRQYRLGEHGILLFPSIKEVYDAIPGVFETIAKQNQDKLFYQKLVA